MLPDRAVFLTVSNRVIEGGGGALVTILFGVGDTLVSLALLADGAFYRRAVAYFNLKDKPCRVGIYGAVCLAIQRSHILIGTFEGEDVVTSVQAGDIIELHALPVSGVDIGLCQVADLPVNGAIVNLGAAD
ncbi:hypothetical protein ES703_102296 [subsurface metagenome]